MKLRHLDLFAGAGGFKLAAEWAGLETVAYCETDEYCSKIYGERWPGIPNLGDVRGFRDWPDLGRLDIITGGFPCQPFSQAGKQRGASDDRYLWPEMLGVIERLRPAAVLGENVAGIISVEQPGLFFEVESYAAAIAAQLQSANDIRAEIHAAGGELQLYSIEKDFEAIGYVVQSFVVPAVGVDARHVRPRVWIIACDDSAGRARPRMGATKERLENGDAGWSGETLADAGRLRNGAGQPEPFSGSGKSANTRQGGEALADSDGAGRREQRRAEPIQPELGAAQCGGETISDSDRRRCEQREASERLVSKLVPGSSDVPDSDERQRRERSRADSGKLPGSDGKDWREWEPEPRLGRVANGVPNRSHRLKALGNAIVPQVAEVLLKEIIRQLI